MWYNQYRFESRITEPAMHLTKVTMTTILSQRKAGPWKRDIEKTKGADSIYNRFQPLAGPGNKSNSVSSHLMKAKSHG